MNLKCFDVNDDIFNKILYDFEDDIIEQNMLEDKSYYDYRQNIIYFKDTKELICQGYILNYYLDKNIYSSWKQVIIRKRDYAEFQYEESIDGQRAWNYIYNKILLKKYTKEEINSILASYQAKPEYERQYHFDWPNESQNVQKLTLCVKYDINGAHTDALCEMFPRCANDFVKMYIKRHTNILFKKYPNYFVGMIKKKGYENAYWWIVNRTTQILLKAMDEVGGQLVYANTDGFCVTNPVNKLNTSDKLGDFKLEYEGDVYIYTNRKKSPYILYQFGDTLIGTCLTSVRDQIDLSKGNVVYYDRVPYGNAYKAENVIKETVCVYKE